MMPDPNSPPQSLCDSPPSDLHHATAMNTRLQQQIRATGGAMHQNSMAMGVHSQTGRIDFEVVIGRLEQK